MKKVIKIFTIILLLSLTIFTTVSCKKKNNDTGLNWSFSKKDASKFVELDANIVQEEDGTLVLNATYNNAIFTGKLDNTTVLLYNFNKLNDIKDYIKYEDIKSALVNYDSIVVNDSKDKITIKFSGNEEDEYGIIIHKDSLSIDTFASAFAHKEPKFNVNVVTEYEESIIKKKGTWDDANKMLQMANYISQMVLGFMSDSPTAFAAGAFGIAQTLGVSFFGKQATIASVSKQLEVVDHKLDLLTAQIDSNQKQIIDEFVRTQAMIDEVKVNQYNQNITAYQTDYVKPLDDYIFIYKDTVEQALKSYVNEAKSISVFYANNYKDLLFKSENDITSAESFTYSIENFSNAKMFLDNNKGIVGEGFAQAITKDIKQSLEGKPLPGNKKIDDVADDVYKTLMDEVNQVVLTKEDENLHKDILQFISNFISYAKALAGVNFESVINSYISRLEYIYNYTSETKPLVRDLLASIKLKLDYYVCVAQTACIAQKINYTAEIAEAYNLASTYISSVYDAQMERSNNYAFALKCNTNGGLYDAICEVSFTNLGNNPNFHSSFLLKKVTSYDGAKIDGTNVDVNAISMVDYSQMRAIITRYQLLKAIGETKSENIIKYLNSVGVIPNSDIETLYNLFNGGRTVESTGRILTSYGIKDLVNTDNIRFTCTCYGNGDGYYFLVNQSYKYRYTDSNIEADYWSGRMAYGDIIDGKNGSLVDDKLVSAYARYSESHWYWIDDEHWGFIDNIFGNFFYILTK